MTVCKHHVRAQIILNFGAFQTWNIQIRVALSSKVTVKTWVQQSILHKITLRIYLYVYDTQCEYREKLKLDLDHSTGKQEKKI